MRRLGVLLLLFIGVRGDAYMYNHDFCSNIADETSLETIYVKCKSNETISGKGYINMNGVSERLVHNFFASKKRINMGLRLFRDENLKVLNLGILENFGPGGAFGGLWIENTQLVEIRAPNLNNITGGAFIRGNVILNQKSLDLILSKVPVEEPLAMQEYGECNIDETHLDFTNCTAVNNLVLPDGYSVPEDFYPRNIYGCVYLRKIEAAHNFLEYVETRDSTNFRCLIKAQQAIEENESLCFKDLDFNFMDFGRVMSVSGNGNRDCKFECTQMDFVTAKQRWCERLDSDLIISDELIASVNIYDFLINLKRVNGIIIIQNLTNTTVDPDGEPLEQLVFPALEFVLGGKIYRDTLILVDNTTLKRLSFPKLVSVRGGSTAIKITDENPYLKLDHIDMTKIEIAANGRPMSLPQSFKKSVAVEEDEKDSESEDEGGNVGLIVGCTIAGAGALLAIVVVAAIVVVVRRRKSKKSKGKEYEKVDNKDDKGATGEDLKTVGTPKPAKSTKSAAKSVSPAVNSNVSGPQIQDIKAPSADAKASGTEVAKKQSSNLLSKLMSKLKNVSKSKSSENASKHKKGGKKAGKTDKEQKTPATVTANVSALKTESVGATNNAEKRSNK